MSTHYRKTRHKYKSRQRRDGCSFCDSATIASAVSDNKDIYVVPNLTQYDLWELHDVTDHLLIIPRRHVKTLSELTPEERLAIMDVCAEYEEKGQGFRKTLCRAPTYALDKNHQQKTSSGIPTAKTIFLDKILKCV